jgi:hypothetical protein
MEKSRGTKNQLEQLKKLKKENFSHPQQPFLFSFRKNKTNNYVFYFEN